MREHLGDVDSGSLACVVGEMMRRCLDDARDRRDVDHSTGLSTMILAALAEQR